MGIDTNTLQLCALILGGVELRVAVNGLRKDVDLLKATKLDKPPAPPGAVGVVVRLLAWVFVSVAFLAPLAGAAGPSVGEAAATGATIGSVIAGPVGGGVLAVVFAGAVLIWRRRKKR